jgi:NitT/TauT family transport system permease protein
MSVSPEKRREAGESVAARTPRRHRWLEFKKPIPLPRIIALGILIWVIFFGLWGIGSGFGWASEILLPTPLKVVEALYHLFAEENFAYDVGVSIYRIVASFALACAVAVPLGVMTGAFPTIEAFFNPLVSAWRYLPAPSFIPLLLMWLGSGDQSKLALLFIGVLWFLTTLIMDHTKAVRGELIDTAVTLGGSRRQVLWTVVIPAVLPNIMVSMRQMMAVSWTYLVIAEIIAATDGIGAMMMRAKRFIHVDKIMAGIVVIGILGLFADYLFRLVHRGFFAYLEDSER